MDGLNAQLPALREHMDGTHHHNTRFLFSALGQLLSTHISATAPCTLPIKAALFLYSVSSSLPAPPPQPVSVFFFFFCTYAAKEQKFPLGRQ